MKMLRPKYAIVFILILGIVVIAPRMRTQTAGQSEREAMYERFLEFPSYVKGGSIEPHWMADGNSFWYAEGAPTKTVVYKVNPKANRKTPLFDTARLRGALTTLLGHEPPDEGLPFEGFTFVDDEEKAVKFTVEGKDFVFHFETYAVIRAPRRSDNEKSELAPQAVRKDMFGFDMLEIPSPDGRWFAHLKDHNLWLRSTSDGHIVALTTDGAEDHEWAEAYEWGKDYGRPWAWWSPDGSKLAVKKVDARHVHKIPIVGYGKRDEEIEWVPLPRVGEPLWQRELYIFDIPTKRRILVDTGEDSEHSISILGWRPDGSELAFMVMSRDHKRLDLMSVNATSGETRVILTETRETFLQPLWSKPPRFILLKGGKRFIWTSERDGWNHLYLYDLAGKLIRRLTEGPFPVHNVVTVDEQTGWLYFTAHGDRKRPYDKHLYRVRLDGTGFAQLTESSGQHTVQFAPSKKFFLDTHSTVDRPPIVELRRSDGELLQTLSRANIDAIRALNWIPPEEFVVKATDGETRLYGVLYKPYDFDPNRKYPVIEYMYDGPNTTVVPRTFSYVTVSEDWFPMDRVDPQALAQLGFIVFIVDGRGTAERGKQFQDFVYHGSGRDKIPDHVATLKQLAERRPYMDLSRVGIFGVSAGGGLVLEALLGAPDVYHVGVALAAGVDLRDLHAEGIEPYWGLPEKNPDRWEHASILPLAENLAGKLLLIHGTSDRVVPISQTLKMVEALIEAGKPYDLILLPGQGHLFTGTGARYAREGTRRYFQEHLKP